MGGQASDHEVSAAQAAPSLIESPQLDYGDRLTKQGEG